MKVHLAAMKVLKVKVEKVKMMAYKKQLRNLNKSQRNGLNQSKSVKFNVDF